MKPITSLNEINKYISTQKAVLIYFSSENCSVCKVLKPKIKKSILETFPKINQYEVSSEFYKEITSNFSVFSIPTIIVFFDSKEYRRYSKHISIKYFLEELKRPYTLLLD